MKKTLLSLISVVAISSAFGQLNINTLGTPETIDFTGFDASGFDPAPAAGQLDSDTWEVLGFNDGDLNFGGSNTTGDFARGTSTGGVTTGGTYSFDNGSTGAMLGVQPGGTDFTPGSFTLKINNNTGSVIADLTISYEVWEYNDQDRSNSFNFSHSTDNSSYTAEASLDYASVETGAGAPTWVSTTKNITLSNVNIAAGADYYLKWESDDISGSGSRDELGIDDISVTGSAGTPTPTINASTSSLTGFTYVEGSGPSAEQNFTVEGSDLTNDITITAPTNYEISETSGSGFTNSITLTQSSGSVATTTIYVRLASGLTAAGSPYNETANITSTGATQVDVDFNGTVTAAPSPTINISTSSLTGFTYVEGAGPSAEQSFTIEGSNLTADISIAAPTNYEISETSGSGFTNSITLTQSSGSVATTTIYVRMVSGLMNANSPFNETVTATSAGATDATVDVEGTVTVATAVNVSTNSLTGFSYLQTTGGPSNFQSFDVDGSGLTGDIDITAPANYEISATSGSGYTNSLTLTPITGTVSATTIYVRLKGSLLAVNSPFNEDITVSSTGVSDQTIALEGEVIDNVGIPENKATTFSIYPNPFTSNFTIETNGNKAQVQLTDVLGKIVYNETITGNKTVVNFDIPAGIYFITVTQNDTATTKKIIKK